MHIQAGHEAPLLIRHSQGDHWDLLVLDPIESHQKYHSDEMRAKRRDAGMAAGFKSRDEYVTEFRELVAWHEDTFVWGPPVEEFQKAGDGMNYFHVEMFVALPGKHAELLKQREMENVYLKNIDRPQNLIFTHESGGQWDAYTLGFYRDLKHFAESADIPEDKEDAAAKKAGFEGAAFIGTYLRSLIARHNDTLANRVK